MSGTTKNYHSFVSNIEPSPVEPPSTKAVGELIPHKEACKPERVLLAAWELHQSQDYFTLEDLIVMSWIRSKSHFGLRGYEEKYPDNKCIEALLYGSKGLIQLCFLKKGYTEKEASDARKFHTPFKKKLILTERGKRMVEAIMTQDRQVSGKLPPTKKDPEAKKIPKGTSKVLDRVFTSKFWKDGAQVRTCRFAEACEVLGITEEEELDKAGLDAKIGETKGALQHMLGEQADYETSTGSLICPFDAQAALRIVEIFEEKYKPHFRLITTRKEKS